MPVSDELMLGSGSGIVYSVAFQLVGAEVKRVADYKSVGLNTCQLSDFFKPRIWFKAFRDDQCHESGSAFRQGKWRGRNVHFPIANHYVAICAEALDAFIFVRIV